MMPREIPAVGGSAANILAYDQAKKFSRHPEKFGTGIPEGIIASEAANRIAYDALQIHGGYGYIKDFKIERLYRDARITTIYEGSSEVQRMVIANQVLQAF